ncbi:MAG: selenocysteine protein [Deltaproteobacteria bacterium]|nr:MAG: selenocysteine protein [Deltaproteobacteria bacterium]
MNIIAINLKHALMISVFVFVMMVLADYLNVLTQGKMNRAIRGGQFRQYITTSFLGATPGCLGAFMNVSFYVHGLITFGAMVGGMIATCGDEAFVMLALFPGQALLLFGILFALGIIFAWIVDKMVPVLRIRPCEECQTPLLHIEDERWRINPKRVLLNLQKISLARFLLLLLLGIFIYGFSLGIIGPAVWDWKRITFVSLLSVTFFVVLTAPEHYLNEHIWEHIVKKHLWRVFLWSFGALVAVDVGLKFWNLEAFVQAHISWVLVLASLVAIIPESGPHLLIVMMFAKGLIPFSVLLASSIIQDGHGMLPLLAYTLKDSVLIKSFNFIIGLAIGLALYSLGL